MRPKRITVDVHRAERRDVAELPLRGRRNRKSANNTFQFFARIEGELDERSEHVHGANGVRWRVA